MLDRVKTRVTFHGSKSEIDELKIKLSADHEYPYIVDDIRGVPTVRYRTREPGIFSLWNIVSPPRDSHLAYIKVARAGWNFLNWGVDSEVAHVSVVKDVPGAWRISFQSLVYTPIVALTRLATQLYGTRLEVSNYRTKDGSGAFWNERRGRGLELAHMWGPLRSHEQFESSNGVGSCTCQDGTYGSGEPLFLDCPRPNMTLSDALRDFDEVSKALS